MAVVFIVYGIVLLLLLTAAIGLYRLLASRSRLVAAAVSLLLLSVLVLLWPIPIHGGFTVLGEQLLHELRHAAVRRGADAAQARNEDYSRRLQDRVAGALQFSAGEQLSGGWSRVRFDGDGVAWHDAQSGLLWSDWLRLDTVAATPSLELARSRCRQYRPRGYWALASEAENYLAWKHGGRSVLPAAPASTVSQLLEPRARLELPVYGIQSAAGNGRQATTRRAGFVVRCVARGPGAPAAGYSSEDIPLAQWNRFQLSKTMQ